MKIEKVCIGFAVGMVVMAAPGVQADTPVGGPICSDTTWDLAGSPYIVTLGGGIVIGCGATLTIEPGVVVAFDAAMPLEVGSAAWGVGTLVARGTEDSPIVFTSIKDPDNAMDPAAPGDWTRIYFSDYAVDADFDEFDDYVSGSVLEHVVVEYAGDAGSAAIYANSSTPFLNYCEVRNNENHGINCRSIDAPGIRIENCYIHDNEKGGIYLDGVKSSIIAGNIISDNTGVAYGGGIWYSGHYGSHTLIGNTITGNTADNGGAISFMGAYYGSHTLTANYIQGNTANGKGGAIYLHNADNITLSSNTIKGNTANGAGGAIYSSNGDNITLLSNTITGNHTVTGQTGGIYVTGGSRGFSLAGGLDVGAYNIIRCNDGYQVYNNNSYQKDGSNAVDARYVLWATDSTEEIMEGIFDHLDDVSRAYVVWGPFVLPSDWDNDTDVDLPDFAEFALCFTGPDGGIPPGCDAVDFDCDNAVDLGDFALFQGAFTGPLP